MIKEGQAKPVRRKKGEEKRWTQEEMLLEAAQTEVSNRLELEAMLAQEEEVKRKAVVQKDVDHGPRIRYISKEGVSVMEFTKVKDVPSLIRAKAPPYVKRAVCVVTGQPARYRDPVTGKPYATIAAFKRLREEWEAEKSRKRAMVEKKREKVLGRSMGGDREGEGYDGRDYKRQRMGSQTMDDFLFF